MQKGDFVRINYIGRLESGEIFDLTFEDVAKKEKIYNPNFKYKPIPVVVGAGFVIPGLDRAISDMNVGEKKSIDIEPKDAFGERNANNVRVIPKNLFKKHNMQPHQGMIVDFSGVKGRVQSVSAGRVMVDFNNPLAGKKIKYELEIVERIEKPEEQVKAILEFFGAGNAAVRIDGKAAEVEVSLPPELKEKIGNLILKNVKLGEENLEEVHFVEIYRASKNKESTTVN